MEAVEGDVATGVHMRFKKQTDTYSVTIPPFSGSGSFLKLFVTKHTAFQGKKNQKKKKPPLMSITCIWLIREL